MPGTPFERVKEIFSAATDLEGEARAAYLAEACGDDAQLRGRVEALLAQHSAGRGLLGDDDESQWVFAQPTPLREFQEGDLLGRRFRVLRYVGRGGMGEVYECEDLELSGRVALKTLRREVLADSRNVARFKREVQLARRVTHPNVCRVFDVGRHAREDGAEVAFLTMEFLAGETLAERLKREGPMTTKQALGVIREIASGLQALHEADIIHRDLKPGNVMLTTGSGGAPRTVITDFGLARTGDTGAATAASSSSLFAGTPAYMSPEQLVGDPVGPHSDVYSLGMVSYEMLTGSLPFKGKSAVNLMLRKLTEEPKAPSTLVMELKGPWDDFVQACLERDPALRPRDPQEVLLLLDDLERSLGGARKPSSRSLKRISRSDRRPVSSGRLPSLAHPPERWSNPKRWFGASFGAAALAAATMLPFYRQPAADNLCRVFPGSALFCALPSDKDVAIVQWRVEGTDEDSRLIAQGLADYLNASFYRLYPNKDSMCVHVRYDEVSEGVNLRMEGSIRAEGEQVRVTVELKDARNPAHRTLRKLDRTIELDDDHGLYLGLPQDLVNLFELGQDVEKSMRRVWEAWAQQSPGASVRGALRTYLLALGRINRGQFQQAAFDLGGIVPRDPQFTAAYIALGDAYRLLAASEQAESGQRARWIDSARNAYDRAQKNDVLGGFPAARAGLGDLAILEGQSQAAIDAYNQALDVDPYDHPIQKRLARAYETVGELPKAEEVWLRALGLKRECWLVRNSAGYHYAKHGQPEKALEQLQEFARQEPNLSIVHNNLAVQYLEMGRVDDSIESASRAVELDPSAMGYSALGKAYFYRGCADDAVVNLRKATEVADAKEKTTDGLYRAVVVWRALAETLEALGRTEEARAAFAATVDRADALLAANPEHPGARDSRAAALARLDGRLQESLSEARALIEISAVDRFPWLTLAVAQEVAGDRKSALEALEAALERGASIHDARNIGALAALREEPEYLALEKRFREDPGYRGGNLNFSNTSCPGWNEPGHGLRRPGISTARGGE